MKTKLLSEDPRSTALVLEPGDEAVSAIEDWARDEGVRTASLTAIGGFETCMLGFFEWESKEYVRIPVDEQAEVVALIGDIAMTDGDELPRRKMDAESGLPLIEP